MALEGRTALIEPLGRAGAAPQGQQSGQGQAGAGCPSRGALGTQGWARPRVPAARRGLDGSSPNPALAPELQSVLFLPSTRREGAAQSRGPGGSGEASPSVCSAQRLERPRWPPSGAVPRPPLRRRQGWHGICGCPGQGREQPPPWGPRTLQIRGGCKL
ncbi:hypothetical protein LUU34_00071900 [Aix galericulata]|nr:hypothetical protein LUU34_00071900 [Aix galericulata]